MHNPSVLSVTAAGDASAFAKASNSATVSLDTLFSLTSWTKPLWQQHKSRKYDGKWSRSDEKPEHRVVSLSGSEGAEKQEGHSEGKGAHVRAGPGWTVSASRHFSLDRHKRCLNI